MQVRVCGHEVRKYEGNEGQRDCLTFGPLRAYSSSHACLNRSKSLYNILEPRECALSSGVPTD